MPRYTIEETPGQARSNESRISPEMQRILTLHGVKPSEIYFMYYGVIVPIDEGDTELFTPGNVKEITEIAGEVAKMKREIVPSNDLSTWELEVIWQTVAKYTHMDDSWMRLGHLANIHELLEGKKVDVGMTFLYLHQHLVTTGQNIPPIASLTEQQIDSIGDSFIGNLIEPGTIGDEQVNLFIELYSGKLSPTDFATICFQKSKESTK